MSFTIRKLNNNAEKGLNKLLEEPLINSKQRAVECALSFVNDSLEDKKLIKKLLQEIEEYEVKFLTIRKNILTIDRETNINMKVLKLKKGAV